MIPVGRTIDSALYHPDGVMARSIGACHKFSGAKHCWLVNTSRTDRRCGTIPAIALLLFIQHGNAASDGEIDFDRDIRPIVSDTCFKCHGPDEATRKAELRLDTREGLFATIDAGASATSELFERISSDDPDHIMPPPDSGSDLRAEQIARIGKWIDQGARWKQHWSLEKPQRDEASSDWMLNPIDVFVLENLGAEELEMSPMADPVTLLRRVSLDITGLPPAPSEVRGFSMEKYEAAVDRLLDRTAYAERMAYRWLDAARYADTSGYQTDGWRDMWRWRDWVIEAFDRNIGFDRFTIEQLAGDLLPSPSLDQLIATGFNRNHRGNAEGGIVPEEFQVEYVVDRVDTTFAVWQGLTIGCARCHNHKYDPISQRDYYQVFACFNNVPENGRALKEGNSMPWIKAPTSRQSEQLAQLRKKEDMANARFARIDASLPELIAEWEKTLPARASLDGENWTVTENRVGQFDRDGGETVFKTGSELGRFGYFDSFSLGAWVKRSADRDGTVLSKMTRVDRGSGYNLHLTESGAVQLNLVKRWLDDSLRVESLDTVPLNRWTHVFASYDGTRTSQSIQIYINGRPVRHKANLDALNQSFAMDDEPFRIGAGNSDFAGEIDAVRVFDRAMEADEVAVIAERSTIGEILSVSQDKRTRQQSGKLRRYYLEQAGPEEVKFAWREAIVRRRAREDFEASLPSVMVMKEMDRPRATSILVRGQYDKLGEAVVPGVPAALPPLPEGAPRNRLGVAQWLVSNDNPLTARVTVNRIWRDLFGIGLVKTTEDFGVQGERPIHPELLDWLAVEFMESGWDVKALVRLIVTSNTYRQSSRASAEMLERDPDNRLLARGPRFRLPAEMIRDQALSVSGLLATKVGGPSVKPYQPEGLWKDIASDTDYQQSEGDDLYRRSLYTFWKRTVPPPMMMNFDASTRESCEVHVRRTNTPLQALNLMNDVTFVEAARVLAEEVVGARDGLEVAFRRVTARVPSDAERERLQQSLAFYRSEFSRDPAGAKALIELGERAAPANADAVELAAWTMLCSALLNLDEVVTKE